MAAVLAAHPAVASHLSAAWLRGLIRQTPARIDVTAPSSRRNRREFRIHFAQLKSVDLSVVDGIPSTSWARTLLDLTPISSDRQVERMLERSEELDSFDLRRLEDVLERTSRHPGAVRLGRAAEIYRPEAVFTRSRLERRFRSLVRHAGLPAPATNVVVESFELDAYWATERFAVELDAYETHGSRAAFERDRERQDELLLIGIEMIRVTGMRLKREPRATIDRVAAHLERRRRERVN
jgi:very-short-patch-repair endonuclease